MQSSPPHVLCLLGWTKNFTMTNGKLKTFAVSVVSAFVCFSLLYRHSVESRTLEVALEIAVITCITGNFDEPPVLPSGISGLQFFLFTDEYSTFNETKVAPWKVVKTPFWKHDKVMDLGFKNSFSSLTTSKGSRVTLLNLINKYYRTLAWRLPLLKRFQYIVYIDGNVLIEKTDLRKNLLGLFSDANTKMWHCVHPDRKPPFMWNEALESMEQERYRKAHVEQQVRHYLEDYQYPDNIPVRWTGMFAYNAWDPDVQRFMLAWNREIQLWSPQCQVSMSFALWLTRTSGLVKLLPVREFCNVFNNFESGYLCRKKHNHQLRSKKSKK